MSAEHIRQSRIRVSLWLVYRVHGVSHMGCSETLSLGIVPGVFIYFYLLIHTVSPGAGTGWMYNREHGGSNCRLRHKCSAECVRHSMRYSTRHKHSIQLHCAQVQNAKVQSTRVHKDKQLLHKRNSAKLDTTHIFRMGADPSIGPNHQEETALLASMKQGFFKVR